MPALSSIIRKGELVTCASPLLSLLVSICLLLTGGGFFVLSSSSSGSTGSVPNVQTPFGLPRAWDEKGAITCQPGSVAVSVATSILNAFLQVVVVPTVQADSNVAVIPQQEDDHIWVDEMILQHFRVDSVSVKTATPDAQSVAVSAKAFGLEVNETRFCYTFLGIRCYGHFTATLNTTGIEAVVGFNLLPENRWNATFTQLQFSWGTLSIQHVLDSKACGIAQSIIEVFTGQMDRLIASKVQEKVNKGGKSKATEMLNSCFATIPVLALTPPIMTSDRLSVVLDATPSTVGCPPQPRVTNLPPLLERDFAAHTTVHDINNALHNSAIHDKLRWQYRLPDSMNTSLLADILPDVYAMCPECSMYLVVRTPAAPVTVFLPTNTITLTVRELIVGLYAAPRTNSQWMVFNTAKAAHTVKNKGKFEDVYRDLGFLPRNASHTSDDLPVLVLSCGATFGAQQVAFGNGRALSFTVLNVNDFDVDVVASLVGDVNTAEIEEKGMKVWNSFLAPSMNSLSPIQLPFFLRKAVLAMTLENADGGVNVGLMDDFIAALGKR
jgi:hypothetical protein